MRGHRPGSSWRAIPPPRRILRPVSGTTTTFGNIGYFYRQYSILVREPDAARVTDALGVIFAEVGYGSVPAGAAREIQRESVTSGLVRLTVPSVPTLVPDLIGRLDGAVGQGVARPEHKIYVCPHTCPATEPAEVPGTADPVPPLGLDAGGRHCIPWTGNDGEGVSVVIVDTGLIPQVAADHPWLAGVEGAEEIDTAPTGRSFRTEATERS